MEPARGLISGVAGRLQALERWRYRGDLVFRIMRVEKPAGGAEKRLAFSGRTARLTGVEEVRRAGDDELCGYVREDDGRWQALTVFLGVLAGFDTRHEAQGFVVDHGLSSLQRHWQYRAAPEGDWQTVLIQEARPGQVRLALGHYSLPGVPTLVVTAEDLASGAQLALPPA
jgi:hypothetical protein